MGTQKKIESDTVKKSTMLAVAIVCLSLGFLGGVVFSAYKSAPKDQPSPAAMPPQAAPDRSTEIDVLKKETARDPNNVSAWTQLGNLYFDTDQFEKAIEAYRQSLKLDPQNANVWTDMGVMYRRSGEPKKAVESFDKAIQANPKHEISRFNKGIVMLHDLNDPQGAIQAWEDLLKINPFAMAPNGQSVDELIQHYK